jgi:hypothetical protein
MGLSEANDGFLSLMLSTLSLEQVTSQKPSFLAA